MDKEMVMNRLTVYGDVKDIECMILGLKKQLVKAHSLCNEQTAICRQALNAAFHQITRCYKEVSNDISTGEMRE